MQELVEPFDLVVIRDGVRYVPYVRGRSRADGQWEAVIEFASEGPPVSTAVETTQSGPEAVLYWARGLGDAYFEGALDRALSHVPPASSIAAAPSLIEPGGDADSRAARLAEIEHRIIDFFQRRSVTTILTRDVFETLPYANADVVRALEDLEKRRGFLVRRTEEGNDWLFLTAEGAHDAGLTNVTGRYEQVRKDPPKES